MSKSHPKAVLIDGNALMHRAYHGVGRGFIPIYNDMPVGMVYGFASTLINIIRFHTPDVLCVTFDTPEKTFRHEMDKDYKAQRTKAPDDFYPQMPYVQELIESFSIPMLSLPGYESDDIIGTLAVQSQPHNWNVCIMSGDFDFLQLVNDRIQFLKFNGKIEDALPYGRNETFEKFGVYPEQIRDYKALVGDSSDNYKGVKGLGPKTAVQLLAQFKSLENMYKNINDLPEKWRDKLKEEYEYIQHCFALATIHCEVPIAFDFKTQFQCPKEKPLAFFEKMNFNALYTRFKKLYDTQIMPSHKHTKKPELKEKDSQMSLF